MDYFYHHGDEVEESRSEESRSEESRSEGSEMGESDFGEENGMQKVKDDLLDCLDDVQAEGSFSSFHTTHEYPNPGLYIHEHGSVGLPLTANDAKAVASVCKQSPFGLKDQTIVDTSVRQTWELDPTQFECRNPYWKGYIENMTEKSVADLGVVGAVRSELYKLLLYEEGAFFKPHKDSEKVPGMFGTMVICLPSQHEGGEVHLSHAGAKNVLKTAPASQFDLTTLAWYSDVTHEVKPLTAGYRLVLTYNLIQDSTVPKQSASLLHENRSRLVKSFGDWTIHCPEQTHFVYILEHKYTQVSLSLDNMKGRDAAVAQYLDLTCSDNNFYFFFAKMEAHFMDMEDFGDSDDEEVTLRYIVTPHGKEICYSKRIENEAILSSDPFERDCDSETQGDFTGNESMPASYRYHDTVVILLPKSNFIEVFSGRRGNMDWNVDLINFLAQDIQNHPTGHTERKLGSEVLQSSLQQVIERSKSQPDKRENYGWYTGDPTAQSNRKIELMKMIEVVGNLADVLDSKDKFREIFRHVSIDTDSPDDLVAFVAFRMAEDASYGPSSDSAVWDQWLHGTLDKTLTFEGIRTLAFIFDAMRELLPGDDLKQSFKIWADNNLQMKCSIIKSFLASDVDAVLDLILHCGNIHSEKILLSINACIDGSAVLLFLRKLCERPLDSKMKVDICTMLLQNNARRICPKPIVTREQSEYLPRQERTDRLELSPQDATNYLTFLQQLWGLEQRDLMAQCVTAMDLNLPNDATISETFWDTSFSAVINFLTDFLLLIKKWNDKSMKLAAAHTVESTLQHMRAWMGNKKPERPRDWTRSLPGRGYLLCNCSECNVLKAFLLNPSQASEQFTMNQKKRKHIEGRLNSRWYTLETTHFRGVNKTLIVTKTNNEYDEDMVQFLNRVSAWRKALQPLCNVFVVELLGEDLHRKLVQLDPRPTRSPTQQLAPVSGPLVESAASGSQLNRGPPQVAGVKRKVEVIDLSSDE